jgi:hypothetical protein
MASIKATCTLGEGSTLPRSWQIAVQATLTNNKVLFCIKEEPPSALISPAPTASSSSADSAESETDETKEKKKQKEITVDKSEALELEKLKEKHELARMILLNNMAVSEQLLYDTYPSAKAIWDDVQQMIDDNSVTTALHHRRELDSLKLKSNETLTQYFSRAITLQRQLITAGDIAPDYLVASRILDGLPPAYDVVRENLIGGKVLKDLALKDFKPRLLSKEQELLNKRGSGSSSGNNHALAAMGFTKGGYGKGNKGGKPTGKGNHQQQKNWQKPKGSQHGSQQQQQQHKPAGSGSSGRQQDIKGPCAYCGKPNHEEPECKQKERDTEGSARLNAHNNKSQRTVRFANVALSAGRGPAATPTGSSQTWYVDSGAGYHITNDKSCLSSYRESTENDLVIWGNNEVSTVLGYGHVYVHDCHGDLAFMLSDVHYAPGSGVNLMSVKKAVHDGLHFDFAREHCDIYGYDGNVALRADATGNALYTFTTQEFSAPQQATRASYTQITESDLLAADEAAVDAMLARNASVSPSLWHRRMCHTSNTTTAKLLRDNLVTGINLKPEAFMHEPDTCAHCVMGKHTKQPFPNSTSEMEDPGSMIHSDILALNTPTTGGRKYVLTLLDHATRYSEIRVLHSKSDAPDAIIEFATQLKRQTGRDIKIFRSDGGGEFVNSTLEQYFKSQGIVHQTSVPRTPEQNGAAERLNRSLLEGTRTILHESGLPHSCWAEAITTVNHVRNMTTITSKGKTPYELWYGKAPDVSALRVFGSTAYVRVDSTQRGKLQATSIRGRMVGYDTTSKGYRILLDKGRVITARDVIFDENPMTTTGQRPSSELEPAADSEFTAQEPAFDAAPEPAALPAAPKPASDAAPKPAAQPAAPEIAAQPATPAAAPFDLQPSSPKEAQPPAPAAAPQQVQPVPTADQAGRGGAGWEGRLRGTVQQPERFGFPPALSMRSSKRRQVTTAAAVAHRQQADPESATVGIFSPALLAANVKVPATLSEALAAPDSQGWLEAAQLEMSTMEEQGVFTEVPRSEVPKGATILQSRFVLNVKHDLRKRVRWVAKGFGQRAGIDYEELFAPVSKFTSLRALLAKIAAERLHCHQVDWKAAFLNGDLHEEIYMALPRDYPLADPRKVLKLNKSLYGLKQAPRQWYIKLKGELEVRGFSESDADPGLFIGIFKSCTVYILLYVDDALIAGSDLEAVLAVKELLMQAFEARDLGEAKVFLGMTIDYDRDAGTLKLSQESNVQQLLAKYRMQHVNTRAIPLSPGTDLSGAGKDEKRLDDTSKHEYMSLVGSLNYLAVCTRPDISFAVGALSRHLNEPTARHLAAAKGVLRYLAGTASHGINYTAGGYTGTVGYCDADYAGDTDTRRSTTGYAFISNGGAISWSSKRQETVALSTVEAEYMASAASVKEALWLRQLLSDLHLPTGTLIMNGDNQGALALVKNPVISPRSKHIDVRYHFLREHVAKGEVYFQYINTGEMIADSLTKAVPLDKHNFCRYSMGIY